VSRLGSVLRLALVPAAVAVAVAGCSSGHKGGVPATSTTVTSTVPASTTTGSASVSTTSSSPAPTTTTATAPATTAPSAISISAFTVSPATPVCNAPTQIELQWTATGATTVDLSIDGQRFATYGGGAQTHLEYFACDHKPHTYLLTARAGTKTATASKVVTGTSTSP
jgi:hypothetical protein